MTNDNANQNQSQTNITTQERPPLPTRDVIQRVSEIFELSDNSSESGE